MLEYVYNGIGDNNLNTGFYNNLDINFEEACKMSEKTFSHAELIELLTNGNIPQKQIAALTLDRVDNENDANILISNLTGCDGKIREAVALKINQLVKNGQGNYFYDYAEIFADSTIDINGNICRLVIDTVYVLSENDEFYRKYLEKILIFINETFDALDKFIYKDRKYVINKQLFKLYWCLESLKLFAAKMNPSDLIPILERAAQEKEYTIREKVAQIVAPLEEIAYSELKERLKTDENYYVRTVFNSLNH